MTEDEPTTPDLVVSLGDCEIYGSCAECGKHLGMIRPDQSLDILATGWERHLMVDSCPGTKR